MLVKGPFLDHLLLLRGNWPKAPASRVRVPLHNYTFNFSDDAMVAGCHDCGVHLGNPDRDRLPLRGHKDDFVVHVDLVSITEQARDHQLRAVTDGVHGAVFNDDAFIVYQQNF